MLDVGQGPNLVTLHLARARLLKLIMYRPAHSERTGPRVRQNSTRQPRRKRRVRYICVYPSNVCPFNYFHVFFAHITSRATAVDALRASAAACRKATLVSGSLNGVTEEGKTGRGNRNTKPPMSGG